MLIEIKEAPRKVSGPKVIAGIFRNILSSEDEVDQAKEHFWTIGLNVKNIILYVELVSLGILHNNIIHPRETFRMAILKAAASIIIGHNHPSGDLEISRKDKEVTDRLVCAGDILGITVLDHIVIANGKKGYFSFHSKGLLRSDTKCPPARPLNQVKKK